MKIMPLKLFPFLLFSDFHIWPKCSQNCLVLTSGELTGVHGCPSIVRSGFLGRCGSTGDFSPSVRVYWTPHLFREWKFCYTLGVHSCITAMESSRQSELSRWGTRFQVCFPFRLPLSLLPFLLQLGSTSAPSILPLDLSVPGWACAPQGCKPTGGINLNSHWGHCGCYEQGVGRGHISQTPGRCLFPFSWSKEYWIQCRKEDSSISSPGELIVSLSYN